MQVGDRFVSDCAHHHPVLRNRRSRRRPRISRFWGDFRRYRAALSVSADTCGLSSRFRPPVSASKNSVPRGRIATADAGRIAGNCGSLARQKAMFRTRSVIIADSIRALRTAEPIRLARHEGARLRYRVANGPRRRRARVLVICSERVFPVLTQTRHWRGNIYRMQNPSDTGPKRTNAAELPTA